MKLYNDYKQFTKSNKFSRLTVQNKKQVCQLKVRMIIFPFTIVILNDFHVYQHFYLKLKQTIYYGS